MQNRTQILLQLLQQNPQINAAWFDNQDHPTELHICSNNPNPKRPKLTSVHLSALSIVHHSQEDFRILITPADLAPPTNINQDCQNEPIALGCQIQPEEANWVGTGGSPVRWTDDQGETHFGVLSNWHVMASGMETYGRKIHQPSTTRHEFARLANWNRVETSIDNRIDAAIADALIDDFHTIDNTILEVGKLADGTTIATVGLQVVKSGRTTGRTPGRCTAVGAVARVGYGDFTATFTDQDIYQPEGGVFSAPGDSGSLIVTAANASPTSLLFAGGGNLTIGNPIRFVNARFNLQWPFN